MHPVIQKWAFVILMFWLFGLATIVAHAAGPLPGCGGGCQNYGLGYYGLGGFYEMPYSMGRIPTPPYFSLHPPVYYRAAVPRNYGYSPFAYPGIMKTPEHSNSSLDIDNPYVEPRNPTEETSHVTAVSVIVRNPFAGKMHSGLALRTGN